MADRQCDKCGEFADDAKAFCPACGNPFVVEEKRSAVSDFDAMDSTVQLGQTMYNQMLSDMGLNVSKPPDAPEKRIEVIVPAAAAPASAEPPATQPRRASSNRTKWLLVGILLAALLLLLAIAVAGVLYFYLSFYR